MKILSSKLLFSATNKNLDFYVVKATDGSDSLILIASLLLSGVDFIVAPGTMESSKINSYLGTFNYEIISKLPPSTSDEVRKIPIYNPNQKIGYFSSGSTGDPKLVVVRASSALISHKRFLSILKKCSSIQNILAFHDNSFVISLNYIYLALLLDIRIISLYSTNLLQVMRSISVYGAQSIVISIPTIWGKFISFLKTKEVVIHTLVSCGEPLRKDIGKVLAYLSTNNCLNMYGASEFATWIFSYDIKELVTLGTSSDNNNVLRSTYVPIGKPLDGVSYLITKSDALSINAGLPQTFYILSNGSSSTPDHIYDSMGSKFIHTGDRALIVDEIGNIECMGRSNGLLKVRGAFLDTYRVNNILNHLLPTIRAVAVTHSNTYLLIIIECNNTIFSDKLKALITSQIYQFTSKKIPILLIREDVIKLNRSGKIDMAFYQNLETKYLLQLAN